ncbi:MAG: Fic family protein [Bryobacteraceae bacterium]|jgi:Fic family protein
MTWNWQQPDWPHFSWDEARLRKAEEHFLIGTGMFVGTLKHLPQSDQEQLTIESLSTEAVTTSEIEGEILDRESVQSSIRRQLGLPTDNRRIRPAEEGVSDMMVHLYRSFAEPLSDAMLFSWHQMLFQERGRLIDVGRYRTGADAMEIVSGPIHEPKVHFEAPPSAETPKEMARFIAWFNRTAPQCAEPLPALTRAGIAHLYFESIHPFEDGNGRIGRAIAEKVLAQIFGQPTLTALAATILSRRKAYYVALEAANKSNEVTAWLSWFAGVAIEAQRRTTAQVEFLIEKTRLLDRLRGQVNARQQKALLRILREGPEGFKGGLSAGNYSSITGASPATATRDLADLVEKGALLRVGERRHARYHIAIAVTKVSPVVVDEHGNFS